MQWFLLLLGASWFRQTYDFLCESGCVRVAVFEAGRSAERASNFQANEVSCTDAWAILRPAGVSKLEAGG